MAKAALVVGCLMLGLGPAGGVAAQQPHRLDARLPQAQSSPASLHPGLAVMASAAVPGAGQYLQGADRWVPFAALEVWSWLTYRSNRNSGSRLAREYRDLAWSVARRASAGARRDTIFDYYEAMAQYSASGTFDSDIGVNGVQPELDLMTYNGQVWQRARALHFPGGADYLPGSAPYARALAYYEAQAIPAAFTWAWGASNLEQQTFRELIRRSDEARRRATQVLGVIVANHVVSAVDALIEARLRGRGGASVRLGSGIEDGPGGVRWTAQARVYW